jgi:threonine dehydrogenase-like Zn-dependent dehydrogenase
MQAASNAAQAAMGPAPGSVVQNEYKPDPSGRKMKALTWQSSNHVKVMECDVPAITQDKDVILKVTGTTICGSDLHLYHGEIVALQKNDILGHEFMGVVDDVGPGVKKLKKGDVSLIRVAVW